MDLRQTEVIEFSQEELARLEKIKTDHRKKLRELYPDVIVPKPVLDYFARAEMEGEKREAALEEKNAQLETRITTDSLVESVSSHGHFLVLLQEEVEATQRMEEPSSFLVTMDLDHFKKTNATLGHPTADNLLQKTGQAIADSLRPGDDPGRTGGDEFSAIIRRTNREGAVIVVQRLKKAVTEVIEEFRQEGFSQGGSIGFCLIPKGLSVKEVRNIADAALYTVKDGGRNQIAVGSLNPDTGSIETYILPSEPTSTPH